MKSLTDVIQPIQNLNIIRNIITEDDPFPNNGLLPLLLYQGAWQFQEEDSDIIKDLLETNGWTNSWIDGILQDHHFHSTAHEVLVALKGSARLQFGGPNGPTLDFVKGDVVIVPAGVAHKMLEDADGFACMGAYPEGQHYDMNYGKPGERPGVDENIKNLPVPENDPFYGSDGPLIKNWTSLADQSSSIL